MVGKVLYAVDGSVPSREAASLAHGLLPKATEVLILEVVPQLPYAWITWPAFPDPGQDMAKASAYVSEVAQDLQTQGWNVSTKVHFSVLGAGDMDLEILKLTETLRPDLICLALAKGGVTANIVRKTALPVLVARPSAPGDPTEGRRVRRRESLEPALVHRAFLLNPAGALVFREAGIL